MSCNDHPQKVSQLLKSIANLLECDCKKRKIPLIAKFSNGVTVKGVDMAAILRIDQKVTLTPGFQDASGNPVTELGSVPVWTISDPTLGTLQVSEDGMSAVVTSTGVIGTAQVNMTVDSDPDDDVEEIVGTLDLEFKAGKARFVSLNAVVSDVEPPAPENP